MINRGKALESRGVEKGFLQKVGCCWDLKEAREVNHLRDSVPGMEDSQRKCLELRDGRTS